MISDTEATIPIYKRGNKLHANCIVDFDRYEFLVKDNKFHCNKNGYVVNQKNQFISHIILGKPKKGEVVDHNNGNILDNRISNLKFSTYSQNAQNKKKKKELNILEL